MKNIKNINIEEVKKWSKEAFLKAHSHISNAEDIYNYYAPVEKAKEKKVKKEEK